MKYLRVASTVQFDRSIADVCYVRRGISQRYRYLMREKGVLTPGPSCTRSAEELGKYECTRSPFTKGVMGSAYNRDLSPASR